MSQPQQKGECSEAVRSRVIQAHARQHQRQKKLNARLESSETKQFCLLAKEDGEWLEETLTRLGFSIRAWQRLLKVARTIADLEQQDEIQRTHLQEALSYRAIDRLLIHLQNMLT